MRLHAYFPADGGTCVQSFVRWHVSPSAGRVSRAKRMGFCFGHRQSSVQLAGYGDRGQEIATISVNAAVRDITGRSSTCVGWRQRREISIGKRNVLVFGERQKGRAFWPRRRRRWYSNIAITLRERAGGFRVWRTKNGGPSSVPHAIDSDFFSTHRPFSYRYAWRSQTNERVRIYVRRRKLRVYVCTFMHDNRKKNVTVLAATRPKTNRAT